MGHRYYDAHAGRFLTRDPIGYQGGLNLYGFAGNNPVNESDPNGTNPFTDAWNAIGRGIHRAIFGNGGANGPHIGQGHGDVGLTDEEMEEGGLSPLDRHPHQAAAQLSHGERHVAGIVVVGVLSALVGGAGAAAETSERQAFTHTTSPEFWRDFNKLPKDIQLQAAKQYKLLRSDPNHSSLALEKLGGFANRWSVRINGKYRAIGERTTTGFHWTQITPHDYRPASIR